MLVDDVLLGSAVRRTFVWMALGLAITGLASHFVFSSNLVYKLLEGYTFWFLLIAEVALVLFLSGRVMKMSIPVATGAFVLYAVLSGVSLSPIYLAYTYESIATTFFITAGSYGCLWLYDEARFDFSREYPLYGVDWACPSGHRQSLPR